MILYGMKPAMKMNLRREPLSPVVFAALIIFGFCFLGHAAGQDRPALNWKSKYGVKFVTTYEGDCTTKVQKGDIVYIRQRGFYADENEDVIEFDNDAGEPFRFVVGEKRIITGMEVGVIGQVTHPSLHGR